MFEAQTEKVRITNQKSFEDICYCLPPNDDIFGDFYVFKTSGCGTLELLL